MSSALLFYTLKQRALNTRQILSKKQHLSVNSLFCLELRVSGEEPCIQSCKKNKNVLCMIADLLVLTLLLLPLLLKTTALLILPRQKTQTDVTMGMVHKS